MPSTRTYILPTNAVILKKLYPLHFMWIIPAHRIDFWVPVQTETILADLTDFQNETLAVHKNLPCSGRNRWGCQSCPHKRGQTWSGHPVPSSELNSEWKWKWIECSPSSKSSDSEREKEEPSHNLINRDHLHDKEREEKGKENSWSWLHQYLSSKQQQLPRYQ